MSAHHAGELPPSTHCVSATEAAQINDNSVPSLASDQHVNNSSVLREGLAANSTNPGQPYSPFHKLPNELLGYVLDQLVHDEADLVSIEKRWSLSSESFVSIPPYVAEDSRGLIRFRNVCRKFWEVGRSRVFARVNIRSSTKCFADIEWLVRNPDIAGDVKKISYMVYDFYPQDGNFWDELLHEAQTIAVDCHRRLDEAKASPHVTTGSLRRLNAEIERSQKNKALVLAARDRAADQKQILQDQIDEQILLAVLTACNNLQQIRLMRVSDSLDVAWQSFLSTRRDSRPRLIASRWTGACQRATIVLGRAYLASGSKASRFSSRFMDPSPKWLLEAIKTSGSAFNPDTPHLGLPIKTDDNSISPTYEWQSLTAFAHVSALAMLNLVKRLTTLELQIAEPSLPVQETVVIGNNRRDLEAEATEALIRKMAELSEMFSALFRAAKNMEGLHISLFRPVSIPLTTIFHDITWSRLRYIGFSRWDLTSDEIIDLLRRHRPSLISVRFREVRLTKGKWIDVAQFLRQELQLRWVSFRQVGYRPKIGGGLAPDPGVRVGFAGLLQGPPYDGYEESSSENSDESDIGVHAGIGNAPAQDSEDNDADSSDNDEPEALADSDTDRLGNESDEATGSDYHGATHSVNQEAGPSDSYDAVGSITGDDWSDGHTESTAGSVAGDSEAEVVNNLALDDRVMVQHSSAVDNPLPGCHCSDGYAWEDLEDDYGLDPTKPQWKMWERWVKRRCSIKGHDPRAS